MEYRSKQISYDLAHEISQKAKKVLGLSQYDVETLEHDINNLRAHEWLDLFDMIPDSNEVKKLYFTHCVELEDETEQEFEESMNTFTTVRTSLFEGIDDMRKFYKNIPENEFISYIELDPTYKQGSDKAGTYAKWILGLANSNNLKDKNHIKDLLKRFEDNKKYLKDKDIMKFKSMDELESYLNNNDNYNDLSHRQEVRQRQKDRRNADLSEDAELVYEDSDWEVWIPKTYAASCKLGQGTSWCTASTETSTYYDSYASDGNLYININKHNPKEKYQFHFESESYMDKDDEEIDLEEFFSNNESLYNNYYKKQADLNIDIDWVREQIKTLKQNEGKFIYKGQSIPNVLKKFITNIVIHDSVTSIGDGVFEGCSGLTKIIIPESVTSIGYRAFKNCGLRSITLPFVGETKDGTKNTHFGYIFGDSTYDNNSSCVPTSLKKVTITSSTSIGDWAFYFCDGLTSVVIPDSVTSIGDGAFRSCRSLTSITIPDSVTSIGNSAFSHCDSLTSITIPDSVTSIGDYAFYNCKNLTSVTIPDSVTSIGDWAFSSCYSLTSIEIPNSVTKIGENAFYSCGLTSVVIPDSVMSIGKAAFYNCGGLTSVEIGGSVTSIGYNVFDKCSSLTEFIGPVQALNYAIVTNLKKVVINSGKSIGSFRFADCSNLTSVTIGDNVTSIGEGAFANCSNLNEIKYTGSTKQWKQIKKGKNWAKGVPAKSIKLADAAKVDENFKRSSGRTGKVESMNAFIDVRTRLNRLCSPYQVQLWGNGKFEIHQVKEDDKDRLVNSLRRISKEVHATANGKYDFSRPAMFGGMHSQYYNIYGEIEMEDKNESLQLTKGHIVKESTMADLSNEEKTVYSELKKLESLSGKSIEFGDWKRTYIRKITVDEKEIHIDLGKFNPRFIAEWAADFLEARGFYVTGEVDYYGDYENGFIAEISLSDISLKGSNSTGELKEYGIYIDSGYGLDLEMVVKARSEGEAYSKARNAGYGKYVRVELLDESLKESLNLTEGHQVREYKGFILDLDEDSIFLNVDEEEGALLPTDLIIDIKFKGKTIHQEKGFRRAREWVDKHTTFKKYTAEDKVNMLETILNKDKKLSVWTEDSGFLCIDVDTYYSSYGLADFIIVANRNKYLFGVRASELVDNIISNNKIDINTMANELDWDIPDEDDDYFEELLGELKHEYVFSSDLFTSEFDDISMLLEEMSKFGLTSVITKDDEIELKKDSQILIDGKVLKESYNDQELEEDMEDKVYAITVKYHNEPKEKIEARSAKDRKDLEYQLNMDDEVEWYDFDESQFNEGLFDKKKIGVFNKHSGEGPKHAILDPKKENEFIEKIKHLGPENWEVCEYTEKKGKVIKGNPVDKYNQIMIDYQEYLKKRIADWDAKKAQKAKEDEEKRKADLKKQPQYTRDPKTGARIYRQIVDAEDAFNAMLDEGYSREGYSWDEVNGMIHIYEDGKLIDKYPDMESAEEAGWDLNELNESMNNNIKIGDKIKIINMAGEPNYAGKEGVVDHIDDAGQIHGTWGGCAIIPEEDEFEILNESLDQMREKALKMKENSNAFAILYGYRTKDGKEVDLEPEEFATEEEYKERIQQITNSFTKLSDKDPRGNRYGKESGIEFYAIYPNKNSSISESTMMDTLKANHPVLDNTWTMGSDKTKLNNKEFELLYALADKLTSTSPNQYKYEVKETYEDYGAGMKWYNIICYDKKGNSWQALNTKEWLDLMNTGDVDKVYQDVVNGDYFQDKQKDIKDMNMGELFNHMED